MDALRSLIYGYSITEANKPRINPFRSRARDDIHRAVGLPTAARRESARFYDAKLDPVKIDLYDVETWERCHWSAAFDPEIANRELKSSIKKFGRARAAPQRQRPSPPRGLSAGGPEARHRFPGSPGRGRPCPKRCGCIWWAAIASLQSPGR